MLLYLKNLFFSKLFSKNSKVKSVKIRVNLSDLWRIRVPTFVYSEAALGINQVKNQQGEKLNYSL